MATYYIDPVNGNDADDGLSWANAFLTLNGAEDEPVAAGDLVYVGPGVYREKLTVDVSGGAGTEIVYVGDVTGEHTDGIGGVVRVTGSDNDQTETRDHCVEASSKDYRTFRGFRFDTTTSYLMDLADCENWTIEDCVFRPGGSYCIWLHGDAQANLAIGRCTFIAISTSTCIYFSSTGIQDAGHTIYNCKFIGHSRGFTSDEVGGITLRNSTFLGCDYAVRVIFALPVGFTAIAVNNCIITYCGNGLRAVNLGEIIEDFNTFYRTTTDRTNVNVGANSETYPPLLSSPILHAGASQASGFKFPWLFGELSEWSQVRAITGSNEPSVDFHGIPRPATASKNSWGAMQFMGMEVESGTVQAGTYARVLHDAGQVLVRRIPVTGVEITVTLYVRREANYAGNLPQMVIKQPGQADQVTVSVAAVNTWEQLSDTFTPASPPGFVEVWVESRNTAAAGNYEVFYDTMG